jgi:hypothetical protein
MFSYGSWWKLVVDKLVPTQRLTASAEWPVASAIQAISRATTVWKGASSRISLRFASEDVAVLALEVECLLFLRVAKAREERGHGHALVERLDEGA